MDNPKPPQSVRQQIKTRVLNMTIGQWMRAIDMVLGEYLPRGGTVEEEADQVTKLALLLMMTRWYDEEDICLLLDSSALQIPKRLQETGKYELCKILDRPSDEGVIEDFAAPDPHASPAHSDQDDVDLNLQVPPY